MTRTQDDETGVEPLNLFGLMSYGLLTMPLAMGGLVMLTYLPTFYAVDLGLGLTAVGIAAVLGRLLDVFTDPVIGHLSDQTRTRFGPRKPWMVVGIVESFIRKPRVADFESIQSLLSEYRRR